MNELCMMIKKQADANFLNLITAIKTYDRNAAVCGAPAWRYVYHSAGSAAGITNKVIRKRKDL